MTPAHTLRWFSMLPLHSNPRIPCAWEIIARLIVFHVDKN
jgi:hypothetical protein